MTTRTAALERAAALAEQKKWSEAADALTEAGEDDFVLDKKGWYLSRAKRHDEALVVWAELRLRQPNSFRPLYMTAYQYYDRQLFADSLPWFEEALKRNPSHLRSWWRRAHALYMLGNKSSAREAAGKVLQLYTAGDNELKERERDAFGKASFLLGRYELSRDPHLAAALLKQGVDVDVNDPYRHYQYGRALRMLGKKEEALKHLTAAHRLKPGDLYIDIERCACLGSLGRPSDGLRQLRQLAGRCRGWQAVHAAKVAERLDGVELQVQMLERAARDRDTRSNALVLSSLERAREKLRSSPGAQDGTGRSIRGTVMRIDPKGRFGFLKDEKGTRRYFRVRSGSRLSPGMLVRLRTVDDDPKGPAADDVQPS